ncbi:MULTISPECIES: hypothetical protein [unclassified Moraxella]|uniref:hypothetical protein n=1 Tax=unclassified Moraxella TaxID=2685852 RepID=UPI003AF959F7
MKIPNYWSSHRIDFDYKNKPREVFRFGWSDISLEDAKNHAIARCEDARTRILAGEKYIKRYDGKGKYLDESGLPIREQVVERYDNLNAVTTINSYGATCLNVENVLILDIDNDYFDNQFLPIIATELLPVKHISGWWAWVVALILGTILPNLHLSVWIFLFFCVLLITFFIIFKINNKRNKVLKVQQNQLLTTHIENEGGYLAMLQKILTPFLQQNPQASFNLYQTPQGFRLIALHDNFTANDEFTQICFDNLPVDTVYQKLCKVQQCFRARVTGKPWRMGIKTQFLGYQDFWRDDIPVKFQQQNQQWLNQYHQTAQHYSACHFIKKIGNAEIHPNIAKFLDLHDKLCKAKINLPLA